MLNYIVPPLLEWGGDIGIRDQRARGEQIWEDEAKGHNISLRFI
jgi:hypothetical protein